MIKHFFAGLLVLGLTGCAVPFWEEYNNVENSRRLRVGMTKSEVLAIMGEPLIHEHFNTPDHWYYFIQSIWMDGINAEEECMPLIFENGKLIGWGREFYSEYLFKRERQIVTPEEQNKKAEALEMDFETTESPETSPKASVQPSAPQKFPTQATAPAAVPNAATTPTAK